MKFNDIITNDKDISKKIIKNTINDIEKQINFYQSQLIKARLICKITRTKPSSRMKEMEDEIKSLKEKLKEQTNKFKEIKKS